MSIYCALIHRNSTVKHIYIKYEFLLHGTSSLVILCGSGSHQSPPGEYKTQLYPPLLSSERFSSISPHYPFIQTLLMEGPGQGPCAHMGVCTLKESARAEGKCKQKRDGDKCQPPMILKEYPESRILHPFEELGRRSV